MENVSVVNSIIIYSSVTIRYVDNDSQFGVNSSATEFIVQAYLVNKDLIQYISIRLPF